MRGRLALMDPLPFFQWCETSLVGEAIKNSTWAFAVIESAHLLGLALIGGCVLIVNLRLLGLGLRNYPLSDLARDVWPWLLGSLAVMLSTGLAMFMSEATKCYYSEPFWVKMASLILAIGFTFTIQRRVIRSDGFGAGTHKAVAIVSLVLWFTVGAAGRWIGFSG